MRADKLILWAAGAIGLGAAGIAVLWFVGKGEVEAQLAEVTTRMDAQGVSLTHGVPQIGGFPLGYEVTLPDVAMVRRETGVMARAPVAHAVWESTAAGDLQVRLPEGFAIVLPNAEAARAADPSLPPAFELQGAATEFRASRASTSGAPLRIASDSVQVRLEQSDYPVSGGLEAADLMLELVDDSQRIYRVQAGRAALTGTSDARGAQEPGPMVTLETSSEDLDVLLAPGAVDWREVLYAGAEGTAVAQYSFALARGVVTVAEDPLGMDGTFGFQSAEGAGKVIAATGALDLTAESRDLDWSLAEPGQTWGSVRMARAELGYTVPTAPTPTPAPGRLKLGLETVEGGADLWQWLDPGGKLDRTPGNLALDIAVTARLMARIDRLPPGLAPPYEVANLSVNQAIVQALGAELQAVGDVEILQPAVVPDGKFEITGHGLGGLATALSEAGLLTPDMRAAVEAILQVYARPGEGEDAWESEVRIGREGLSVNGLPVR